ncbi:unnamed protein product [Cuscuta europaea]|uniref:Uncharacterized protein n=1 Tax=Cuscuta europaea TaxID=41803 RepID=A0A9P0ZDG1_CUSEU|nr:unnamed protein product [Cuscuta europaea]
MLKGSPLLLHFEGIQCTLFLSLGFFPTGFFLMRFLTRHLPMVDQKVSTLGPLLKTCITLLFFTSLHVSQGVGDWKSGGFSASVNQRSTNSKFFTKFTPLDDDISAHNSSLSPRVLSTREVGDS